MKTTARLNPEEYLMDEDATTDDSLPFILVLVFSGCSSAAFLVLSYNVKGMSPMNRKAQFKQLGKSQ